MLTMFTALEARATSFLQTAREYSIYEHIEIRILDAVQHGAKYIIYAGDYTDGVISAFEELGYRVIILEDDDHHMLRIDWEITT